MISSVNLWFTIIYIILLWTIFPFYYRNDKYDLFLHNCNAFSNEVAQFLTGKKIPSYITDLPQEVMSTPFGAMIAQFFENVRAQPNVVPAANSSAFGAGSPSGLNLDDDEPIFEGYTDTWVLCFTV